jgi:predicted Zn-dependent peptidase
LSLTSLARRASSLQRYALYGGQPDGFAAELARYRAVTRSSIDRALARWLRPTAMVEIETVPGAR